MHLNPHFWSMLGRKIALDKNSSIDNNALSNWVSLLLATAPPEVDVDILLWLGERCIKQEMISSLLQIFDAMAESRLQLTQGIIWPDMEEDKKNRIDVNLRLVGDHYQLNELWQKGLKPALDKIAGRLLELITRHLERQHFILCAWQMASPKGDSISSGRSAIEPHDQDRYPEAVDVLIDVARDCLEFLSLNGEHIAAEWCDRQVISEVPLMRRLALHTLSTRIDLLKGEKLHWLLTHGDLYDISAHHEIFQAVLFAYSEASQEHREALIKTILAYQWPNNEPGYKERTARKHFDLLNWIHNAAPDCPLAKKALDDVLAHYPKFRPREHPDLTHWTSVGWGGSQSPWTVEELLAKSATEWLPKLLTFQPEKLIGPDWDGLIHTIAESAKREFSWGLELAVVLSEVREWDSKIWSALIRAWAEVNLNEVEYRKVLRWLSRSDLYRKHARSIADVLHGLVKNDGKPNAIDLLPEANKIAMSLWDHIEQTESLDESDDWLTEAINHPAGILTEYWIESLSLWRKQQEPTTKALNDEYRRALTTIVKDHTIRGRLGRSVLASQFNFFLNVDEEWTRENLLSLFDVDNGVEDFQAAWDGFLIWSHLNPAVAELLEEAFLKAIQRIESDFNNRHRRVRFVEFYTVMLGFFAQDPFDKWIPSFFKYGSLDTRSLFALNVKNCILDMDETQQHGWWYRWLKIYWENRLQGVPDALEPVEIERMLDWLPHLQAVFPEAVDLAIRMPHTPLQRCSVIYHLSKSNLLELYPESVGKLLIFIGACDSPRYNWHKARDTIEKLIQIGVSSVLEKSLKELLAKLGL